MADFPDVWRGEDATITITPKGGIAVDFNAIMQNLKVEGGEADPSIVHMMGNYDRSIKGRVTPLEIEYDVVVVAEQYFKLAWGGSQWDEWLDVWSALSAWEQKTDTDITAVPTVWAGAALTGTQESQIGDEDGTDMVITASGASEYGACLVFVTSTIEAASATAIAIRLKGYGSSDTDGLTIQVWDDNGSAWETLTTSTGSADEVVTAHITANVSNYINASKEIYFQIYTTTPKTGVDAVLNLDYVQVGVSDEVYPKTFYMGDTRERQMVTMLQSDGAADGTRLRHNIRNCFSVQLTLDEPAGDGKFAGTLKLKCSVFDKDGNKNAKADTTDAATTRPLPALEDF